MAKGIWIDDDAVKTSFDEVQLDLSARLGKRMTQTKTLRYLIGLYMKRGGRR